MFRNHSKGLVLLFSTEMWERFSFYTMRALLVLYMVAKLNEGGLGWTRAEAISLYAIYMGAALFTPIFGGYLADRYLGQRLSAMIGAFFMAMGYFFIAIPSLPFFYLALIMVCIGNGFFKPCLTSILGELYDKKEESLRDSAYSIFYMGINIGGMSAGFIGGSLMQAYGYDVGFLAAGFGMVVGIVIFWWGKNKYLGDVGVKPQAQKTNSQQAPLTSVEKNRMFVVFFLFLITLVFIIGWEQMGGVITLYIQDSVNRHIGGWEIPTPWLANIDPLFIVLFAPVLSGLWTYLGKMDKDPFIAVKVGIGCLFLASSFMVLSYTVAMEGMASWGWIVFNKFLVVLGELCVIPMSWAAVSQLTPKMYVSRMMGLMLAGIGIGSYFAGYLGSYVDDIGEKAIFDGLMIGLAAVGVLCFMLSGKLKKMSYGDDKDSGELRSAPVTN